MQGNVDQQQQPPALSNFIFLNSISSGNYSNHPSSLVHHLAAIPLQEQDAYVSDFHGGSSLRRFHHNPLMREVKQGLSLSLSPAGTAAALPGGEEVRVPNNVVLSRKYLKAAQELLDEVVCLGKEAKNARQSAKQDKNTAAGDGGVDGRTKRGDELTAPEKQDIQMKKTKLINMLHQN